MADAGNQHGIAVGEHVAHDVADGVQALDGLVIAIADPGVGVNVQAEAAHQQGALDARSVERRGLNGGQVLSGLVESSSTPLAHISL